VFAAEPLFRFLDAVTDLKLPVLAGVWPLASFRNAQFMKNEVPGVVVPDELLARMGAVESRDDQRKIGVEIAREMVAHIRHRLAGLQVSAPMGNIATALAVLAP
jgi:homocysteine S-methyltransferase